MKKYSTFSMLRLLFGVLLALALLPSLASADTAVPPAPVGATATGVLQQESSWIAYSFPYPGDASHVQVTLSFTPLDGMGDQGITLNAYSPSSLPPDGTPMGQASDTDQPGVKTWAFSSDTAGNYVVIVNNWDPMNRPIPFTLSTTDVDTGTTGPSLTLVSSGPAVTAPAGPPAPAPVAAPPAQASGAASGTTVSGTLQAASDWAAYTFPYAGDGSNVQVTISVTPVDQTTNQDITLDAYDPNNAPPNGVSMGSAAPTDQWGVKQWTFNSDIGGTYTIVVHSWDSTDGPVQFTLSTTNVDTGTAGPPLTFVSSGP